ncbi:group-specific protein [Planococcus sp. CPCC 101016]|uniref:group-specific protein n=1 Tax=Planococcus sp. CPCC 101016 TaxID=2599617 RepID=UPI0011B687D1|nr:group-specific protein [Planococcus sp. CPCC 101016]TWT08015.1 group-specific protein [Planococcus sp. CPCC 101016]
MKFYVASGFLNKKDVQYVSRELIRCGFILTYNWTKNERPTTLADLKAIGIKEKHAVLDSDIVVILLPGGKGTHIELGIALAAGKKVFLYSPNGDINDFELTSTFYHLPEVEKVIGTVEDLIRKICS